MPQDVICPHCRGFVPLDSPRPGGEPTDSLGSLDVAHTIEMLIPGTLCGDDHPHDGPPMATRGRPHEVEVFLAGRVSGDSHSSTGSSEFDPLTLPVPDPVLDAFLAEEPTASLVSRPSSSNGSTETTLPALDFASPSAAGEADPAAEPEPEGGPSWLLVLLASYASATTLAILWLLWSGHGRPTARETLPAPSRIDSPKGSGRTPLAEDRLTSLGKNLTVGSLEFTPLEVGLGPVPLKGGGGGALILRARFRNISTDETFAPLEKALIRVPDSGGSETIIETGGEPIDAYPLAVASERALRGQSFATLGPGESLETIVVSDRDASGKLTERMTWRIRLRVNALQAATVGVAFGRGDVR